MVEVVRTGGLASEVTCAGDEDDAAGEDLDPGETEVGSSEVLGPGPSVIDEGQPVMMTGFLGTCLAQRPTRVESAFWWS